MTVDPCPTCGHKRPRRPRPRAERLDRVGHDWTVVAIGSSRYHRHKLAARHPAYEFRHHRNGQAWTVEARRR